MGKRLFQDLDRFNSRIALITETGTSVTYGELLKRADQIGSSFTSRGLTVIICKNSRNCIEGYVGLARAGVPLLLLHHTTSAVQFASILKQFDPDCIYAPKSFQYEFHQNDRHIDFDEYSLCMRAQVPYHKVHSDLCLLLTTSGTTGSRSFVRLSTLNVTANAASIIQYLAMKSEDRAMTTMPMSYSYGLSIINSHLMVGASLVLTEATLMSPQFWASIKNHHVTTFGGVPFIYEMLKKLRFEKMDLPSLDYITQAGGKMNAEMVSEFSRICDQKNMKLIIMYGQTEATARMAYLPWSHTGTKPSSIGVAIPGGNFSLIDEQGGAIEQTGCPGQLVYRGANVSMGYAESFLDLTRGDDNQGILRTGDIAVRDEDGFYAIVGRAKRFLKIFGYRVNLDDVERILKNAGLECACGGIDDRLKIYVVGSEIASHVKELLTQETNINPQGYEIMEVDSIPRMESGKTDYTRLNNMGNHTRVA